MKYHASKHKIPRHIASLLNSDKPLNLWCGRCCHTINFNQPYEDAQNDVFRVNNISRVVAFVERCAD